MDRPAAQRAAPGPWIRSPSWDLTFIIGSGILVGVPILVYYGAAYLADVTPEAFREEDALHVAMFVNLAVAGFIGGPHMYATFTFTLAERSFRRKFKPIVLLAPLIPITVVALAFRRVELLMTIFFTWASVHVLHQLVYIVRQYQNRAPRGPVPLWSRAIDYVLAFTCLYPIAFWRLIAPPGSLLHLPGGLEVSSGFYIGDVDLSRQLPAIVRGQMWMVYTVWVLFGAAVLAFLVRSVWELFTGRIVWPRTLLLLLTVPVAFLIPTIDNLDIAFQGFNLWHSFQYLGLVYLINAYRKERGEISNPFVHAISGFGNGLRYYGCVLVLALATASFIACLHYAFGLGWKQVYYSVVLSVLLIHYLFDHAVFFTADDALVPPETAATSRSSAGR